MKTRYFATTAKGMEDLLADELRALGAQAVERARAGVSFEGAGEGAGEGEGDLKTAYRACLWSRIANRVLLPLKTFPAPAPEKLYAGVKSIRWSDHLTPTQTLVVDFAASRSKITHTQFGALKAKDAIVDQFRSNTGARPSVDVVHPDIRVNIYLLDDQATVSLDLSGESLHRRGYRDESTPAPLKENLAAAILYLADWPRISRERGAESAFLDPMCGSGTLPIEAALIALNRAPGLDRKHFGFLGWAQHDARAWKELVEEAIELEVKDPRGLPKIVGYDADADAVRAAITNVERADLRQMIHVEKRDLAALLDQDLPVLRAAKTGIVVVNPPYGERLGDVEELQPLYGQIGDVFKKRFQGWNGYVFTGSPELAKRVGLKASRRSVLYNGALECRLLKYELY